jgi:GMP synthase (glutamine-hydrolysing)
MKNPQKHVYVLQHHECETLGIIADALKHAAITPKYIRSFEGEAVPKDIGGAAGLIVMGGPQSVYEQDKFPWLRDELRLIENALKQTKPILGVCLGSQLLAAALGANVYAGRTKEIGWNQVTLTDFAAKDAILSGEPSSFIGFHWHGDIFDLPRGGTLLASFALTAHQAFRYGTNAYGTLFHLEVTLPQIDKMVETFANELRTAGLNGSAIKLNAHTHLPVLQKIGKEVFARWVGLLGH